MRAKSVITLILLLIASSGRIYATPHDGTSDSQQAADCDWWTLFEDPLLDSLVETGVKRNYNVAAAAHRISVVRAQLGSARAAYYPTIGLSAGFNADRISGATGTGAPHNATESSYWSATATMSWEIDVFGKITSRVREQKALVNVSAAEYDGVELSVEAEIASAYINLRTYQAQLEVAKNHIDRQDRVVKITEARHECGLASMLDVSQARTVYYSTSASVPLLETSITTTRNALAVLLATSPDSLPAALDSAATLPQYRQLVGHEIALEQLRRRPDIVAAERNIEASANALGIARKEYLPSLTITGSIGTEAHSMKNLFTGKSFVYSVGPALSWTVFDGFGRRYADITARENLELQIENYNLTLATAVEEADNAMAAYVGALKYIEANEMYVDESRRSYELSIDLYKQGLTAFTNVVSAQLNLLESQNTLVSAQGRALTALVSLHKALGGGCIK